MSSYNSLSNVNDDNIRFACLNDIPGLTKLENECWPEPLRAPEDEIRHRITLYRDGQVVCEINGEVVGAIYSQRIRGIDCLNGVNYDNVSSIHTDNGVIAQLLAVNVLPSMRHLGVGDQLLNFMLRHCLEDEGLERVIAVSLCQGFVDHPGVLMEDYICKRDERGQLVDKILRFHECHGARIVDIVPGFRPRDVDNLGNGILVQYDKTELSLFKSKHKEVLEHNDRESLATAIKKFVCSIMGTRQSTAYSTKTALLDMGLSSLDLFGLRMVLCRQTGADLDPAFFFRYSNPDSIIEYFFPKDKTSQSCEVNQNVSESVSFSKPISVNNIQNKLPYAEHSVAIIGIACRFPNGVNTIDEYWRLLRNGEDVITEIPEQRKEMGLYFDYSGRSGGKAAARYGGFLNNIDLFDAQFFNIASKEAVNIDPQQRFLLELTWEALENAGINPESLVGSQTGVFVGVFSNDYELLQIKYNGEEGLDSFFATGSSPSLIAGRVSYVFGFNGPAISVNTACSSSLTAVHMARQSLLNNECDIAIASGVNLLLSPELNLAFSEAGMLSPDGRCKTFDADANGYVRSEGCGTVVLKPLLNAIADNDNIFAVVRGSALNHDGASNGLTAPNGIAQEAVIHKALSDAGLKPEDVSYIEAHGTGTELGDPVEFKSIENVFAPGRSDDDPLFIGSVKTNIGHAEAASGIAGLIKTVLSMRNGYIPAHLHLKKLNPLMGNKKNAINIPMKGMEWPRNNTNKKHIAGVSSFGFSGTNAHLILEEAGDEFINTHRQNIPDCRRHLLVLSAKDGNALKELAQRYEAYLRLRNDDSMADICYTANSGRAHFDHRFAIVAESAADMAGNLNSFLSGKACEGLIVSYEEARKAGNMAFLFTGQGAQYVNMGRELYETQPLFRDIINECGDLLNEFMETPLLDVIYPSSGKTSPLDQTQYTQPALFSLEYALAGLWASWGIKPQIVIGHSVGEFVAACVAGVFSLKDGLKLIANRARLMGALPRNGEMWALFTDEKTVAKSIAPYTDKVAIAAVNGPNITVVSGSINALQKVIDDLSAKGVSATQLSVSHAFHSPLMEPMLNEFRQIAREISFSTPVIPVISNVTGSIAGSAIADPDYWTRHVVSPVRFASGMETLFRSGYETFLEIGPKPVLTGMGRRLENPNRSLWKHSLNEGTSEWGQMLLSLGSLYVNGVDIDWQNFYRHCQQNRVELPTYPFQRQRYWLDTRLHLNRCAGLVSQGGVSETVRALERSGNFTDEELKLAPRLLKTLTEQSMSYAAVNVEEENIFSVKWKSVGIQKRIVSGDNVLSSAKNRMDGEKWIILSDKDGLGVKLASMLREHGAICTVAFHGESYEQSGSAEFTIDSTKAGDFEHLMNDAGVASGLNGIILLCGLEIVGQENDVAAETIENESALWCRVALYTIQALNSLNFKSTNIWLVTQGAQCDTKFISGVAQSTLWGLGKVIMREHPKFHCRLVDIDPLDPEQGLQMLQEEILFGESHDVEPFLSFLNGQRRSARFTRALEPANVIGRFEISSEGTYLITGGLGGIGLHVVAWLAKAGAKHLVLIGRTGSLETATGEIKGLENKGCEVVVMCADVSNKNELALAFNKIEVSMPPLMGVFHCAGIFDDRLLVNHEWEIFERVFAAKVRGAWNLHLLSQGKKLHIFALFSSLFSVLPEPGLGNYAAANSFMDSLARYRNALGLPGLSINWGPWGSVGMAKAVGEKRIAQWAAHGIETLTTDRALQCLEFLIRRGVANGSAASLNPSKLVQSFSNEFQRSFFRDLVAVENEELIEDSGVLTRLENAPKEKWSDILHEYICSLTVGVLGLSSSYSLDEEKGFFQLGMDSLTSMEMRNRLESGLERTFQATLLFKYPSIVSLTDYLTEELSAVLPVANSDNKIKIIDTVKGYESSDSLLHQWNNNGENFDDIPDVQLEKSVEEELVKLEALLNER